MRRSFPAGNGRLQEALPPPPGTLRDALVALFTLYGTIPRDTGGEDAPERDGQNLRPEDIC
jgi:hypothetical protein